MTIKHYINQKLVSLCMLSCMLLMASCSDDAENFENKVYINSSDKVVTLLLRVGTNSAESVIQTAMAKPEAKDIQVTYKGNHDLVAQYNEAYYDKAMALPDSCYEIPNPKATIMAGSVKADDVSILFKNLTSLNRDSVYVLPVSIDGANISVLEHSRTTYFVFKGAALINTVANISGNKLRPSFTNASALNNMNQLTVEALVRVDKFEKLISTIMGIEGSFLIRVGDAGLPDNQIQLATSAGNVTNANWTIETGKWVHVALTFDSSTGATDVYINGVKKGDTQTSNYRGSVNWGNSNFWIGYSYDDNRFLDGDISECRIWNRVLSVDEINVKDHFYVVDANATGLVAYWKFNEGAGMTVTDYSQNGNNAIASGALTWKSVELPAK
jgi:hypothetical protein